MTQKVSSVISVLIISFVAVGCIYHISFAPPDHFAKVYKQSRHSIVQVIDAYEQNYRLSRTRAAGFSIKWNGTILTVAHAVLPEGDISIINSYTEKSTAKVICINPEYDLALLKTQHHIKPLVFGKYRNVYVGQWAMLIGHPKGYLYNGNMGNISGLRRKFKSLPKVSFVQINVATLKGNSGGPILNAEGQVIGVLSKGSNTAGFAIDLHSIEDFLEYCNF